MKDRLVAPTSKYVGMIKGTPRFPALYKQMGEHESNGMLSDSMMDGGALSNKLSLANSIGFDAWLSKRHSRWLLVLAGATWNKARFF